MTEKLQPVVVKFKAAWWCDPMLEPPLFLPSLALDYGTPGRNDAVGAGRLRHLKFGRYLFRT